MSTLLRDGNFCVVVSSKPYYADVERDVDILGLLWRERHIPAAHIVDGQQREKLVRTKVAVKLLAKITTPTGAESDEAYRNN